LAFQLSNKNFNSSFGRSCRELERERNSLVAQEKKIIAEMKKYAKEGEFCSFNSAVVSHAPLTLFIRAD
jgi:hypothetical protein